MAAVSASGLGRDVHHIKQRREDLWLEKPESFPSTSTTFVQTDRAVIQSKTKAGSVCFRWFSWRVCCVLKADLADWGPRQTITRDTLQRLYYYIIVLLTLANNFLTAPFLDNVDAKNSKI